MKRNAPIRSKHSQAGRCGADLPRPLSTRLGGGLVPDTCQTPAPRTDTDPMGGLQTLKEGRVRRLIRPTLVMSMPQSMLRGERGYSCRTDVWAKQAHGGTVQTRTILYRSHKNGSPRSQKITKGELPKKLGRTTNDNAANIDARLWPLWSTPSTHLFRQVGEFESVGGWIAVLGGPPPAPPFFAVVTARLGPPPDQ